MTTTRTALQSALPSCTILHGRRLVGVGTARFGWFARTVAGMTVFLGRTPAEALSGAEARGPLFGQYVAEPPIHRRPENARPSRGALGFTRRLADNGWSYVIPRKEDEWEATAWPPLDEDGEMTSETLEFHRQHRDLLGPIHPDSENAPCCTILFGT